MKKDKLKLELSNRSSVYVVLDCKDTVEVTDWTNMNGITIMCASNTSLGTRSIDLTFEEFDAIKACVKKLDKI